MPKKILVIDDDTDIVDTIKIVLESNNFDVVAYNDTNDVLERVQKEKPDLLLLDVMFPENPSGGFDMAREIKSYEENRNLPIIILSSVNEETNLNFSTDDIDDSWMPVNDFVEKPFVPKALVDKVKKLLNVS